MRKVSRARWLAVMMVPIMLLSMAPAVGGAGENECGECGPLTVDLIAGQNEVVGTVTVENDSKEVCVTYQLDKAALEAGWLIYETHLYVGDCSFEGVLTPTNTRLGPPYNANPIPGEFPYGDDELDGVEYYTECISLEDLGLEFGDCVCIAAHAVVQRQDCVTVEETFEPELTWKRSTERTSYDVNPVANFPGYGGQWTLEEAFGIELDDEQLVWDNGTYQVRPDVTATSYASWKYAHNWSGPDNTVDSGPYAGRSDLRRFNATFEVPPGYDVLSGTISTVDDFDGIPINDNVYVFVNEELLFWGGTRVNQIPNPFMGMAGVQALRGDTEPKETDRWYIPGTLPSVTDFEVGTNHLDVFTEENERWGGMGALKLTLDVAVTTCTVEDETAWGDGNRFNEQGNWGMWFKYKVCEPEPVLVERLIVPADAPTGVTSSELEAGTDYRIVASGTWKFVNWATIDHPDLGYADAKYSHRIPLVLADNTEIAWVSGDDLHEPYTNYLELLINGQPQNWGDFNPEHVYELVWTGNGDPLTLQFSILDNYYPDNVGSLTVEIYELP